MALQSSRKGLRKEQVDYLGNIKIDERLKQDIVNSVNDVFASKSDVLTYEEIIATTNLTGKIASASALKSVDDKYKTFSNNNWLMNVDLNNYIKSGIYNIATGLTNAPANEMWSPMLVLGNAGDSIRQIIFTDTNHVYLRSYQNSTWHDWAMII